jgi:acyl-CoA thioesterase
VTDPMLVARRVVDGMLARDAFSRWLGLDVTELAPGACTCAMTVRPEMVNGFGVAHGGIVFGLADSALAFASNSHGRLALSIENSVRYPAPVHPGDVLTARASERRTTNRLGFYTVTVTNQDDVEVGLFTGTVYRTEKGHESTIGD